VFYPPPPPPISGADRARLNKHLNDATMQMVLVISLPLVALVVIIAVILCIICR
jgi:hypothetical protein